MTFYIFIIKRVDDDDEKSGVNNNSQDLPGNCGSKDKIYMGI